MMCMLRWQWCIQGFNLGFSSCQWANFMPTTGVIKPSLCYYSFYSVSQTHITHREGGVVTMVSRPRVSSMRKKMIAQKGDRGSLVSASGYTTKAMPGPVDSTRAWIKTAMTMWWRTEQFLVERMEWRSSCGLKVVSLDIKYRGTIHGVMTSCRSLTVWRGKQKEWKS